MAHLYLQLQSTFWRYSANLTYCGSLFSVSGKNIYKRHLTFQGWHCKKNTFYELTCQKAKGKSIKMMYSYILHSYPHFHKISSTVVLVHREKSDSKIAFETAGGMLQESLLWVSYAQVGLPKWQAPIALYPDRLLRLTLQCNLSSSNLQIKSVLVRGLTYTQWTSELYVLKYHTNSLCVFFRTTLHCPWESWG